MERRLARTTWALLALTLACSNETGTNNGDGSPPQDRVDSARSVDLAAPVDTHTSSPDAIDAAQGDAADWDAPIDANTAEHPADALGPDRVDASPDRLGPVDSAPKPDGNLPAVTVYIAGDSTVSDYAATYRPQAGWGQMLPELVNSKVTVVNKAIGGRTARRFISEGRLAEILKVIKAGDYLLVQFGTNDSNKTATYGDGMPYYAAPADFKTYMAQYVTGARDKKATAFMVTPPPRRSCDTANDSKPFGNGTGAYATAMLELGASMNAPVVDLNAKTLAYLNSIGCAASAKVFLYVAAGQYTGAYAGGASDSTHFQEYGARKLAGFVGEGLKELRVGLAAYLKTPPSP
jgi:lysophospholipase L1-like esterase